MRIGASAFIRSHSVFASSIMKIVFLQDDFPPDSFGGAGISTYDLAVAMEQKGHEVFVITTCRSKGDAGKFESDGLTVFKITVNYSHRLRSYKSLYNRQAIFQLEELLQKIRPDIVHINNIHSYLSYYSVKLSKRYAGKVVFTARDTMSVTYGKLCTKRYLEDLNDKVYWYDNLKQAKKGWNPLRNMIIRSCLRSADERVAISKTLRHALVQNGIDNVKVVHNGIDPSGWSTDNGQLAAFIARYDLQGKKVLLFSGRLSGQKGGEQAIRALQKISVQLPNTILLVAGIVDEYAKIMQKLAGNLGVDGSVVFTGWLERKDIKLAYQAADIVLMPSLYLDAFGRVNIEAMAAKKPVIGTKYGGTKEIVEDGQTGYIVDPRDSEEIAVKAVELLENEGKAREFGENGYRRVLSHFNLADKAEEYITLYKEPPAKTT